MMGTDDEDTKFGPGTLGTSVRTGLKRDNLGKVVEDDPFLAISSTPKDDHLVETSCLSSN